MREGDGGFTDAVRLASAQDSMVRMRTKLLDTTKSNALVSFRHSERSRTQVRLVAGTVDGIHDALAAGKELKVDSLPPRDDEPADERTEVFASRLEAARLSDEEWSRDIAAIPEGADDEHAQVARAERRLRNRVRKAMGLPESSKVVVNVAEHARRNGIDPNYELSSQGEPSDGLQTLLFPDVHERKLAGVRDSAQSAMADLGVNTLFAAFGFLEWYESEDSDRPLIAPLLLLPVAIDRKLHYTKYVYTLAGLDGDLEINVSLSERLNHDWNFVLPELGEDEAPSSYIARVDKIVKRHDRRWRVRTFVTVGHFAFARIAMYHDLDPAKWPASAPIEASSIILSMLGGGTGDASTGSVFASEHNVESEEAERLVPLLVTDADSSQHSAIMDALSGKNLVIEGPPGTGKSQTITNLIAAALAVGKTVLFVAEKMPALQVVKSRLDAAGLGHFCLELHSGKTKRRDVVASLQKRLEMTAARGDTRRLEGSLKELRALRSRLSAYADALNEPLGNGLTGHDALWGDQRRRLGEESATSRRLDALSVPGIEREDADRVAVLGGLLESFENTLASLSDRNPWTAVRNASMSPAEVEPVARMAEDLSAEISRLASKVADLAAYGFDPVGTLREHHATCEGVAALATTPWKAKGPLVGLVDAGVIERLSAWRSAFSVVTGARSRIENADYGSGPGNPRLVGLGPAEAAAEANAIAAALADLADWCPDLGILERLPELAAASDASAQQLRTLSEFLTRVSSCLGAVDVRPRLAMTVLDLAAHVEPDLGHATVEMIDQTAAETIAEAERRAASLSEQAIELALWINTDASLDPARLRGHAEAIEGAGTFGFLKGSVRTARRYWKTVSRNAAGEPVAVMRRAADHLDALVAFDTDPTFRSAFGRRWRGRETDFERTGRVVAWAQAVRSALDRLDPASAKVRADFLRLDTEYLEDLAALSRSEGVELLRDGVEGRLGITDDIAGHSAWHVRRRDYLVSLREALAVAGVTSGSVETVAELVADLRRIADAEPRLHDEAIVPFCTNGQGDFDDVRASELVEFGTRLRQSGLPNGTVGAILAMGTDGLLSSIAPAVAGLASRIEALGHGWVRFTKTVDLDVRAFCDAEAADQAQLSVLIERLDAAAANPTALASWTRHLSTRRRAVEARLGDLCVLREEDGKWQGLPAILERTWYRKMASDLFRRHPALTDYNGTEQDDARANFRELDRRIMALQREALRAKLGAVRIPPGSDYGKKAQWTELALIQHETTKKQKHVPVRHLVARARKALVAMKPCFMMSPLTVAQYLPKSGLTFDLVVIDEASQMKPEDAMGAMARGRQTVIVGDPQQLPPSKFFAASTGSGDGDDEEDDDASDLESILDLASATFRPKRRLRWHYRSRHGSLIAFSNRNFYEDDLVVFPSPTERMEGAGVTTRFVEDGAYRNRTNLPEAQAVCGEALRFIRANPDRSLGIVAINAVQAQLIRDEMDRVFSDNPDAEEWRLSWEGTLEPFICKALEMIQGDERDAIFISTVYGKNADGKVSNNFGEINKAAGHRRLNVLFTRAKHAVRLFTSLRPEDVRLTEKTPRGTRMLHEYLRFAQSGKLDGGTVTDREPDSDFEVMVAEMLRARGFEVVPQVGVSGFRIDLAVRDQDVPGGFLAGIECDGATYHSSKSARDRDRLRQEVLEGLGWTIYRIWSTDWYRDPRREADKAAAFLEDLRRTRELPDHALFRPFAETVSNERPLERERTPSLPANDASVQDEAAQSNPAGVEVTDGYPRDLFSIPQAAPAKVATKAISNLQDRLNELAADIDREVGVVPVERHILRPEIRDIFIRKMPESASQFRMVVPLVMRENIEPRHMRYLEEILDTLAE